ncbi:MAG: 50S ribosomal protein L29 [Patescibacteria group bacterium]
MTVKELREKSDIELDKVLAGLRDGGRDSRFRLAGRELAGVRAVREAKKTIARILTLKTQRQAAKESSKAKA